MKRAEPFVLLSLSVLFLLLLVTPGIATETEQRSEQVTTTASVQTVEPDKHQVIIRDPEGRVFPVKAGQGVTNFSQLKPGDRVVITYYDSNVLQLSKPGQQPMPVRGPGGGGLGQQPGRGVETMSGTVESIDRPASQVTLQGPQGRYMRVRIGDPTVLAGLRLGEQLSVTYTEPTATSIQAATG